MWTGSSERFESRVRAFAFHHRDRNLAARAEVQSSMEDVAGAEQPLSKTAVVSTMATSTEITEGVSR